MTCLARGSNPIGTGVLKAWSTPIGRMVGSIRGFSNGLHGVSWGASPATRLVRYWAALANCGEKWANGEDFDGWQLGDG